MKRTIDLRFYERHDKVNFYTFQYVDEKETEFDKFLNQFDNEEFKEDIDILLTWINKIGKEGAHERYFRPEKGNMMALPHPLETSNLRLFCYKSADGIIILGSGGEKTTKTYNEDPILNAHAENLFSIGKIISDLKSRNKVTVYQNEFYELKTITFEAI